MKSLRYDSRYLERDSNRMPLITWTVLTELFLQLQCLKFEIFFKMQISAGDWYAAVLCRMFMMEMQVFFFILFRLITVSSVARDISRDFQLFIFSCFYHSYRNLKTIIKQNEGYLKRSSVYNRVRDTGEHSSVSPGRECTPEWRVSRLGHPTRDHKIVMPHSYISHEVFLFVCLKFKTSYHSVRCTTDFSVSLTIAQCVQWLLLRAK
jgi:hypothetical protein